MKTTQTFGDLLSKLEANGCTILATLEVQDKKKQGVIEYKNKDGEFWTAAIMYNQLTNVMIKGATELESASNFNRWAKNY